MQPVVDWSLKEDIPAVQPAKKPVPEEVLEQLGIYKEAVDTFFLKERKGIYQKYAFAPGAELQEKFETESELNKLASASVMLCSPSCSIVNAARTVCFC